MDDFYLVIVLKEDKVEWAKILLLGKHKYIHMKLIEDNCIQISTIIDKKTSYIIFENNARAKYVYSQMRAKKKSAIMKELTIFSDNVESLQKLLKTNNSTDSFDILTKTFNYNQFSKKKPKNSANNMIYARKRNNRFLNPSGLNSRKSINEGEDKILKIPPKIRKGKSSDGDALTKEYIPKDRKSQNKKYIPPTLPKLGESRRDIRKRTRFQDDNKVFLSNSNQSESQKKKEIFEKSPKKSVFTKNRNKSPFGDIFKE